MKTVDVVIQGTTPLLINRFKEQDEIPATMVTKGKKDYGTPRYQAEMTAYRDEDTKRLWVPCSWISGSIATIASDYKLTGSKKSVKSVSGGAIVPTAEKCYFVEEFTVDDVEIDSRPVVVNRARIMRHRARLEEWTLAFSLEIDENILPTDRVKEILDDAGRRSGMGDYRPPKGGPFGKYIVVSWQVQKGDIPEPKPKPVLVAKERKKKAL